jgi:hypothetical protein
MIGADRREPGHPASVLRVERQDKIMHAFHALTEINISPYAAHIACIILVVAFRGRSSPRSARREPSGNTREASPRPAAETVDGQ